MSGDLRAREQQRCRIHHLTATPSSIDPRVRVQIRTTSRTAPLHLSIRFPLDGYPLRLVTDLADAGWDNPHLDDLHRHPANPHPEHAWEEPVPYPTGELILTYQPRDDEPTDLDEWTPSMRAHRAEIARCVLRRYGITRSGITEQTWHDLI
jgi:hypothetical protein